MTGPVFVEDSRLIEAAIAKAGSLMLLALALHPGPSSVSLWRWRKHGFIVKERDRQLLKDYLNRATP